MRLGGMYRLITSFFCLLFAVLSAFALVFYTKSMPSCLTYTSQHTDTVWYAHLAALLLYCMGGASWIFIGGLILGAWWHAQQKQWRHEWDRVCAWILLIVGYAGLCSAYRVDTIKTYQAGGLIGYTVRQWCVSIGGLFLTKLFFCVVVIASLIVITRWCYMPLISCMVQVGAHIAGYIYEHRILQRIGVILYTCIVNIVQCIVLISTRIWQLLNGKTVSDAGLSAPDDAQEQFMALQAFAHALQKQQHSIIPPDAMPELEVQNHRTESVDIHSNTIPKRTERKERSSLYALPALDIFVASNSIHAQSLLTQELEIKAQLLEEKLQRFGIAGSVTSIKAGPLVTLYEYQPTIDTKISKIIALEDDLALALQALSIRIIAPIPGKSVVGFEVANGNPQSVLLSKVLHSQTFKSFPGALPLALGVDTIGESVIVDLAKMPHLLIAGSTGSGKSVALNAMLTSLLCHCTPQDMKLILIDPKRLEFASYADIAHLLFPIVTDPRKAAPVLRWVVKQMEQRYELMAEHGVRTVKEYNAHIQQGIIQADHVPFIVIVIDELSDLMMTAGRDVEDGIARIAQMARAAGIHLIVATQRPSVDVITGLIKVNFPSRISFRVTSRIDSRTILDTGGAEKLIGRGDALFLDSTAACLRRIHGAYVSDKEINTMVEHIKKQSPCVYLDIAQECTTQDEMIDSQDAALYEQVLIYLKNTDEVSISSLQREFRIGYNRSARIIDQLEKQGFLLPPEGSKPRKVVR